MNNGLSQLAPSPLGLSLFWILLRTTLVYAFLVVGLRLSGKRNMGQMSVTDLVLVLIVSNSVQNAMVGPDTSLVGGLTAAAFLLTINRIVDSLATRSERVTRWVVGQPTLLINDGKFIDEHLRKECVNREQVLMAIRAHGVEELDSVHMAVLEVDGSISIVPISSDVRRTRKPLRQFKDK